EIEYSSSRPATRRTRDQPPSRMELHRPSAGTTTAPSRPLRTSQPAPLKTLSRRVFLLCPAQCCARALRQERSRALGPLWASLLFRNQTYKRQPCISWS